MEKSVTDAINFRRSVRKFDPNKEIDTEIVKKCIEKEEALFRLKHLCASKEKCLHDVKQKLFGWGSI